MLNVSKTKIMLIGTHQRLYTVDSFSVTADNTSLERLDTFKYPGVLMDQTVSWKEHVSSTQLISESYDNSHNGVKITPQGGVTIFGVNITPKRSYFFL